MAVVRRHRTHRWDVADSDCIRFRSSFPSPEWHAAVIADRLANPVSGRSLTLDEARQTVQEAFDARRAPN